MKPLPDDVLIETVRAVREHGSLTAAGKALGLHPANVGRRMKEAHGRGLDEFAWMPSREPVVAGTMRILALDIETAPNLAYVWGLYNQNIAINQIENAGYVLCWSAKWLGEPGILFESIHDGGRPRMLGRIHALLSEAHAVLHYNGTKFDMPTLNKEFVLAGLPPPEPYHNIDLYLACRSKFRFASNKLDYISQALGIGEKVRHTGHELWVGCMKGDPESWTAMEEYNRQDVALVEALYYRILPWLSRHPSHGAITSGECCPRCGSADYAAHGYAYTQVFKYRRYRCNNCGGWFRGNRAVNRGDGERMHNVP